jgi:hypothetical protein
MRSSPKRKKEFVFGSFVYHYDLVMQDRKTLSLTVAPDLQICVKCPHKADDERVNLFLRKKWFWLEKQLCFFKKYQRKIYEREYLSGESFLYLGKQYKLLVQSAREDKVSMTKGLMVVQTTKGVQDGRRTKRLLDEWYKEKMERIFQDRYDQMKMKFDYKNMPSLVIREMQKRWGSYLSGGRLVLNPKLIHVSKDCIDYVIVHELCHVKYKSHNQKFYDFLKKKYPRWKRVKEKLEMIGVQAR